MMDHVDVPPQPAPGMLEAWQKYQAKHGLPASHMRTFMEAWVAGADQGRRIDPDNASSRIHAVQQAVAACNRSWPNRFFWSAYITFAGFNVTREEFSAEVSRLTQLEKKK